MAFQGERGAFSEEAAVKLLGEQIELVPRPTFEAMFAAIDDGAADFVLAPVENSLAGSVYRNYDLLLESKLIVGAEVVLPISHNLIGPPGATFEQVRTVQSHPVALAQCTRFFEEHPAIQRVVAEDTGGSAREVVSAGDPSRAAIASRRAAEIYGGVILKSHLEDHRENYTRFLLLSRSASHARGSRQDFAGRFSSAPARRALSSLGADRAAKYQSLEDRKPAAGRASVGVLLLSRSAGFPGRRGNAGRARRTAQTHPRVAHPGLLCRRRVALERTGAMTPHWHVSRLSREAAVDVETAAGHVGAFRPGQERHQRRNLTRLRVAAQRGLPPKINSRSGDRPPDSCPSRPVQAARNSR